MKSFSLPTPSEAVHLSPEHKKIKSTQKGAKDFFMLPLVDKFRTANWAGIKSDLQFSGILGLFPMLELQN